MHDGVVEILKYECLIPHTLEELCSVGELRQCSVDELGSCRLWGFEEALYIRKCKRFGGLES